MEGTKSELKILLSNLKSKRDDLDHVKLQDFMTKNSAQMSYQAGDLILYDSHLNCGLVLQVLPEFLRVLTTSNEVVSVKPQVITKKIFYK